MPQQPSIEIIRGWHRYNRLDGLGVTGERTLRRWVKYQVTPAPRLVRDLMFAAWDRADSAVREGFLAIVRQHDPGAPADFNSHTASATMGDYFYHLASGMSAAASLSGVDLFRWFWNPINGAPSGDGGHAALLCIWDENHHYDVLPTLEVARTFGLGMDLCPYDLRGNAMYPGKELYNFTRHKAYCLIGRPSLYKGCATLYDGEGKSTLVDTKLRLPEVNQKTSLFLKKPLSALSREQFHCVEELCADPCYRHMAEDRRHQEKSQLIRTDYALIQRVHVGSNLVVVLAGCTALGTYGAVNEAVTNRFPKVSVPGRVSDLDRVEILLKIVGSVPSGEGGNEPRVRPWTLVSCDPLLIYINGNRVNDGAAQV